MSLAEEGAYRRAIDYCWLQGYLPIDPKGVARIIGKGCTEKVARIVIEMFVEKDGQLLHDRLLEEKEKQEKFREKQTQNGNLGGRPKNPKETHGLLNDNPNITSPISNLQSPISTLHKESEGKGKPEFIKPTIPELVNQFEQLCMGDYKSLNWTPAKIQTETKAFNLHYDSNGWMIGTARMDSWRASVEKWIINHGKFEQKKSSGYQQAPTATVLKGNINDTNRNRK